MMLALWSYLSVPTADLLDLYIGVVRERPPVDGTYLAGVYPRFRGLHSDD